MATMTIETPPRQLSKSAAQRRFDKMRRRIGELRDQVDSLGQELAAERLDKIEAQNQLRKALAIISKNQEALRQRKGTQWQQKLRSA